MIRMKCSPIGFMLGAALLGALTGCVHHAHGPPHARGYAQPPPIHVERGVVVHDDYVYYPGYQVYYSSSRRHYTYREGRSWVSRPTPPRVSVDVLFASPSVRMEFHDSPAIHHAAVVRQYPKNWAPPGSRPHPGKGNKAKDNGKWRGRGPAGE